jgi:uncharacterized membrane protein YdjX (TVP38/TMEM64 family)
VKSPARYGIGIILVAAAVVASIFLPVAPWALAVVEWVHDAGAAGVGLYALAYVVATLLFLPGSVLTIGAGFAYGPLFAILLVSPVSVLAATVAFLAGRSIARPWVARRMAEDPRFASIDAAVGDSGFLIVLLLRLSPLVPFNLLNYALGLTRIRLRDYVLASWIGMLPGTLLYVYLGSLLTSTSQIVSGERPPAGGWGQALYWGGFVATVLAAVLVARVARRALNRALETRPSAPEQRPREVQP